MFSDDIHKLKDEEKEAMTIEDSHITTAGNGTVKAVSTGNNDHFILGLILVGVGAAFLLANLTGFSIFAIHNWWAVFILAAAIKQFSCAWNAYRRNGRLGHSGRSALTGGLFITLIAATFLFGISWNFVWPFFLILGGISAILGGWFN